jgi:hypothetical protein
MKTKIALVSVLFLLLGKISHGDVISPNTHHIAKCVKITNIDDYPEVALIGYGVEVMPITTYIISSTNCLSKGYKFNTLNVLAVNKIYLESKELTKTDWLRDINALPSNIQIDPEGGYIHDSIPLSAVEEYYKIVGFSQSNVILFKWKEVTKYNNGLDDSIKTFTCTEDVSKLNQKIISNTISITSLLSSFDVYPNPAYNKLNVKIESLYPGIIPIEIINMEGKVIRTFIVDKHINEMVTEFNIEDLSVGTYSVSIKIGKYRESKKIVIK